MTDEKRENKAGQPVQKGYQPSIAQDGYRPREKELLNGFKGAKSEEKPNPPPKKP